MTIKGFNFSNFISFTGTGADQTRPPARGSALRAARPRSTESSGGAERRLAAHGRSSPAPPRPAPHMTAGEVFVGPALCAPASPSPAAAPPPWARAVPPPPPAAASSSCRRCCYSASLVSGAAPGFGGGEWMSGVPTGSCRSSPRHARDAARGSRGGASRGRLSPAAPSEGGLGAEAPPLPPPRAATHGRGGDSGGAEAPRRAGPADGEAPCRGGREPRGASAEGGGPAAGTAGPPAQPSQAVLSTLLGVGPRARQRLCRDSPGQEYDSWEKFS